MNQLAHQLGRTSWRKLAVGLVGAAVIATSSQLALDSGSLASILVCGVLLGVGGGYIAFRLDGGPRCVAGNTMLLGLLPVTVFGGGRFGLTGALLGSFLPVFFASIILFQINEARAE